MKIEHKITAYVVGSNASHNATREALRRCVNTYTKFTCCSRELDQITKEAIKIWEYFNGIKCPTEMSKMKEKASCLSQ